MKKLKRILAILMVILLAGLFYCSDCACNNRRSGESIDGCYLLYCVYFRAVLCYGLMTRVLKTR